MAGVPVLIVFVQSYRGKVIGAERGRWEVCSVEKVAGWIVGPCVTHGDRNGDIIRGDDHRIADNFGIRPNPFFIFTANEEPFERAVRAIANERGCLVF